VCSFVKSVPLLENNVCFLFFVFFNNFSNAKLIPKAKDMMETPAAYHISGVINLNIDNIKISQ
jgi:hypothetical protein